jgi:hypothetical protein
MCAASHGICAETPSFAWAVQAGGNSVDGFYGQQGAGIAVDSFGDVYIAGFFTGTVTFGDTSVTTTGIEETLDIYIAKYDASGNFKWVRTAGGQAHDEATDISAIGSGGVIITGYIEGDASFDDTTLTDVGSTDVFVAKYDVNGELLWVRQAGSPSFLGGDFGWAIAADNAENCVVFASFSDTATVGDTTITDANGDNVFVAKYTGDGDFLWVRTARTATSIWSERSIATDSAGDIFVAGAFTGTAAFDGLLVTSSGGADIYAAKYSPAGNVLWLKRAGGTGDDHGRGIATTSKGECVVSGFISDTADFGDTTVTSAGSWDVVVAMYDPGGAVSWVRTGEGVDAAWAEAAAVDVSDNILVTGRFADTLSFSGVQLSAIEAKDIFVAKYDEGGNLVWAESAGGPDHEAGLGVAADDFEDVYITGWFDGSATFGSHVLSGVGLWIDIFIAKLDAATGTGIPRNDPLLAQLGLAQNIPNPFNPTTRIDFYLDREERITLIIYDVEGRVVRELIDRTMRPGSHTESWDGRDTNGNAVASGVYFYRLNAGRRTLARKAVLLK